MSDKIGVYKAIIGVQSALAKEGISKDRTNTQGSGYKFRGIDDVYNALAPLLAENGLCILPRILHRDSIERVSKQGGALFYTTVEAEFDFVSAEDGSKHTVRTFGEAMDSGDKGTNKAMSAAYKYAAFQAFCIPTEGENDADATTHEVKPQRNAPNRPQEKPKPPPLAATPPEAPTPAQKLLTELAEFCGGVEDMMELALKEHSEFTGTNGPVSLTLEKLKTTPKPGTEDRFNKWCNKTRDSIKKAKESTLPSICVDCGQPIFADGCACPK